MDTRLAPNAHVAEYLKYYSSFAHAPGYAVLINGPWGIGKTHFVKKFLSSYLPDSSEKTQVARKFRGSRYLHSPEKYVYVSLYGLGSADEIDGALLASIYPILSLKGARITGRVARSVLKYMRVDVDLKQAELLSKPTTKLYVFDDLERCRLDINAVLGYINQFVEQDGCKVVLIANEKEIKADEYLRRREKLIGKTLEFESVLGEALAHFVSQVDDEATRNYLHKNQDAITTVYNQSALDNLRILQQSLWDFERLHRVVLPSHRANETAMAVLLRLFLAISFELKAGRIGSADLRDRMTRILVGQMTRSETERKHVAIIDAAERYPGTSLGDSILSDEVLVDVLVRGLVNQTAIANSLNQSPYYVTREDEPAWRVLCQAMDLSDDEFEKAFAEVERQFVAREVTASGEILHVLGLRLWLCDVGVLAQSSVEIVNEGKAYIEDLYRLKRLDPMEARSRWDDMGSGYGGFAFFRAETVEFRELFDYLVERRERAAVDGLPQRAADLLAELQADPDLFYRRVCHTNSADNLYWRTPVLSGLDPREFVDIALRQPPSSQRVIFGAFKSRYQHGQLNDDLAPEKPWLESVRNHLMERSSTMSKLGQYRIKRFIAWYLPTPEGK